MQICSNLHITIRFLNYQYSEEPVYEVNVKNEFCTFDRKKHLCGNNNYFFILVNHER